MIRVAASMDALDTKRLATGALIFTAALLFLWATSEPTSTAVNLLVNDSDNNDVIVATGTHMQMTEYADTGQRLYSLKVAEWTQYRGTENTHIELLHPEMRLFDDSDTTPWQVSAKRGSATKLGNQPHLTLSDQVQLRQTTSSAKSLHLRSERLSVDATNESVTARGNVILNFGALRTTAPIMILHKNSTLEFSREANLRVVSTLLLPQEKAAEPSVARDV